jgi:thiol-disulfide isomerase/thioredoxin
MPYRPGRGFVVSVALAWTLIGDAAAAAPPGDEDRLVGLTRAFATLDVRDMDGRRWTAADLRGRVVVLDFWATWCPPCWDEIPWLRRIHEGFDRDRVQVIGISLDVTDRRTLVAWMNRRRVDWPQIWEPNGYDSALAGTFGVDALPASLLAAPDGRVVGVNLRGARLVSAVEALLGDR